MAYRYNVFTGEYDYFMENSSSGNDFIDQIDTDSGTVTPASNTVSIIGGTGVNTEGSGSTVTINIDVPVTVANGGTGLSSITSGALLVGNGIGAITLVGPLTNGQLLIGSTGVDPVPATITAGTGITITNGAGSIQIDAAGSMAIDFDTDSGTATPSLNTINILGGDGLQTSGSGSTITIDRSADGYPVTPYVVGPSGQAGYSTIQAGVNAANSDGGGIVVVQPGTYVEDLTLYDSCHIMGMTFADSGGGVVIQGKHTPPTSGGFCFNNVQLESSTHIFDSASAGSTHLIIANAAIIVTNGYTYNLPNWTGKLETYDVNDRGSTNDGFINNTGGSEIAIFSAAVGAGTSNPLIASGLTSIFSASVGCDITCVTGCQFYGETVVFLGDVTFNNNSTGEITLSEINGNIIMDSSNNVLISESLINSATNPCVQGSGAGTLTLTGISFINNSELAGTLTLGNSNYYPAAMTDGQLLIGSTGQTPDIGSLTSTGSTITVTPGAGTINLETSASVPTQFDSDSGSATPALGVLDILGGTLLNTSGATNVITVNADDNVVGSVSTDGSSVTPASNAFSIVGASTAAGTSPVSTSGATSVVTVNVQTSQAIASTDATKIGLCNFDSASFSVDANGFVTTSGTGIGETITGDSGGALSPTAGNWNIVGSGGVSTSGSGSTLTIDGSAFQQFTWSEVTGTSQAAAVNNGYVANNASLVTITLPATAAFGSIVHVVGKGAGLWKLAANSGQTIIWGNQTSTTAGAWTATNQYDAMQVICTVANTTWTCTGIGQGNVTPS